MEPCNLCLQAVFVCFNSSLCLNEILAGWLLDIRLTPKSRFHRNLYSKLSRMMMPVATCMILRKTNTKSF